MELWFAQGDVGRLIVAVDLTIYACSDLAEQFMREADAVTQRGGALAASNREQHPHLLALAGSGRPGAVVLASSTGRAPVVARAFPLGRPGFVGLDLWRAEETVEPTLPDLGPIFGLTRGETALLRPLLRGLSNEQIARELDVSIETVRTHLRNACSKLGVSGRGAAVAKISGFLR